MSLRDSLKQAVNATSLAPVAGCMPIGMQHATFPASDATGNATIVQLPPATQREYSVSDATAYATTVQLEAETDATFGPEIEGESCTPVASALTAHRKVKELIEAAMLACDHWQDDYAARQQMIDDCHATPPDKRQEWIDYFVQQYPKHRTGGLAKFAGAQGWKPIGTSRVDFLPLKKRIQTACAGAKPCTGGYMVAT